MCSGKKMKPLGRGGKAMKGRGTFEGRGARKGLYHEPTKRSLTCRPCQAHRPSHPLPHPLPSLSTWRQRCHPHPFASHPAARLLPSPVPTFYRGALRRRPADDEARLCTQSDLWLFPAPLPHFASTISYLINLKGQT